MPAGCCELDCIYDITGVLKDGHLVTEAVVQLYENFLAENGGGKYDKWMEIIENSVEKCQSVGENYLEIFFIFLKKF